MCGFILSKDFQEFPLNSLKHRGPDSFDRCVVENYTFYHWRLSIIGIDDSGKQPMRDEHGNTIVFNGEIYNYRSLKKDLIQDGITFNTDTDTEVLLKLLVKEGVKALQKLQGMFAFAFYSVSKKEVLVARDRLGIKPLYYKTKNQSWAFSSEIKPLIFDETLHSNSLAEFLATQSVGSPNTLLNDIKSVRPATYIIIAENNCWEEIEYWSLENISIRKSSKNIEHEIREKLNCAVERRLVSDVPLGSFLSGGLDSSLIVGIASKLNPNIKTLTVGFENEFYKDGLFAKKVATHFQTDHVEKIVKEEDVIPLVTSAMNHIDHPSADAINTFIVSKLAKEAGLTVALSGLGADELFAGYSGFPRIRKNLLLNKNSFGITKATFSLLSRSSINSSKMIRFLSKGASLTDSYYLTRELFNTQEISALTDNKAAEYAVKNFDRSISYKIGEKNIISSVSKLELSNYTVNVLLRDTDVMSMANQLEVRVPFLDHELVEYVLGLDDSHKLNRIYNKELLINAYRDLLPKFLLDRPKQGFIMPLDQWMKAELKDYCFNKLQVLNRVPILNHKFINAYWNSFLSGDTRVNWSRVWLLVSLGVFVEKNNIYENFDS